MREFVDIVPPAPRSTPHSWTMVAKVDDVPYERGIAALVNDEPVAIFRLACSDGTDEWHAVSHIDPVAGAPVMARGLVGSVGDDQETPTVASPLHKRRYDLRSGTCLDDDSPALAVYQVLIADGWLLVTA